MHDHLSALPRQHLKTIQGGMMRYQWRGIRCNKPPFDLALYPVLLWQQKPRTIIEIGTSEGGSALWLADTCRALELETRIISIDLYQHAKVKDPHITFLQGDGRALGAVLTDDFMRSLPHPLLVIEDADHHYLTTLAVLDFMARHLREGEYIIAEDGICDSLLDDMQRLDGGPNRAISEFLARHPEFSIDRTYCDWFGPNVTWNTNGYLRRRTTKARTGSPGLGL